MFLEEDGQFRDRNVAALVVIFAGDGAQREHLAVLRQRYDDFVNVGQLVALCVNGPVVGVADLGTRQPH